MNDTIPIVVSNSSCWLVLRPYWVKRNCLI